MSERDPVCGMSVEPGKAKGGSHPHAGVTYWFCGPGCRTKFARAIQGDFQPDRARPREPRAPASGHPTVSGGKYTCPMHPEVIQDGPGSCPICGMALEPVVATLEAGPNPELVDLGRRFFWTLPLSIAAFALGMSDLLPGMPVQRALGAALPWIRARPRRAGRPLGRPPLLRARRADRSAPASSTCSP